VLIEETKNVNKKRFYPSHRRVRSVPSKLQTETPEQLQKLRDEISQKLMKVEDQSEGPLWQCIECDKQLKKKDKMESHIETHLEGLLEKQELHCMPTLVQLINKKESISGLF